MEKNQCANQGANRPDSQRSYIAIDLRSFYASVECMERGLNPLKTNLVVADSSRTEKTICLAVSPSLKSYGIPGRARLFEVVQKVKEANAIRLMKAPRCRFTGESFDFDELNRDSALSISYIAAQPRMALYIKYSTEIYGVYLKYIAPEDIHVYSIDEVLMDVTDYLHIYKATPRQLAARMIQDVFDTTGITATAGIGTNLYLCKIAMDIHAKHVEPDENGVRIAELDEMSYRRILWNHRPLTDFWRIGRGYAAKLEKVGLYTMGDIARCSLGKPTDYYNEDLLYKIFGINAELLIDHAWGWEPCTMKEVKAYRPESKSVCMGQVLQYPYTFDKALLVAKEMADALSLDLVAKGLVTDQIVITVGYDRESLADPVRAASYHGEVTTDYYGRKIPKNAHGTFNLSHPTSSTMIISDAVVKLFTRIVNPQLLVRRMHINGANLIPESSAHENKEPCQLSMFDDLGVTADTGTPPKADLEDEKQIQKALLDIKKKYGKNAIVKGMDLEEGATTMNRNGQIGGHKA